MFVCTRCERQFEKLISLSLHFRSTHKSTAKQLYIELHYDGIEPTCACGCGENIRFVSTSEGFLKYKWGHQSRINNNWGHNKSALENSKKERNRLLKEGKIQIWNKGLTKETDERVAAYTEKMNTLERAEKISKAFTGRKKTEKHRQKIQKHMQDFWGEKENRDKQSIRQAEWIKNNGVVCYKNTKNGWFNCTKGKKKKVYYRSSYELNTLNYLERNDDIVSYEYEPFKIPYLHENTTKNYVIDFIIEYKSEKKAIVEIKPDGLLSDVKNQAKFTAAQQFALANDYDFEIWTEKTHDFLCIE